MLKGHVCICSPDNDGDADEGRRKPLYFSRNRAVNHIELLHEVTQTTMADLLERSVGWDWEQRYDALTAIREQQAQIATKEEAHGKEATLGAVWAGVRRTSELTSAVGLYGYTANRDGQTTLQFRPVVSDLNHLEAERQAASLKQQLLAQRRQRERDTPAATYPTFEIDF